MQKILVYLIVFSCLASTSWAATFNVSNFTELAAALSNANDNDVIEFNLGSTITMAGDLTIDDNLTINGNGATLEYNNTTFRIRINDNKTVVINDLTFQNANSGTVNNNFGGCLWGEDFITLNLNRCNFFNNTADFGGAIRVDADGEINITDCTFNNNRANFDSFSEGGCIHTGSRATIEIENSNFQNTQSNDQGGVMYINFDSDLTILNSTFENTTGADDGGVIYLNSGDLTKLEIHCSTFRNNVAVNQGGVLYNNDSGAGGIISNCIFEDNAVISNANDLACRGGAIYHNGGPLEIRNSIFNRNRALPFSNQFGDDYGGGAIHHNRDDLTINNCSFSDNETNENGTGATIRVSVFNLFNTRIVDLLDIRNTEITNSIGGEDIYFFGDPATAGFVLNSDNASITSCATSDGDCPTFTLTNANDLGAAAIDELCSEEAEELPTIGQWGLILFGLLLISFGLFSIRRSAPQYF